MKRTVEQQKGALFFISSFRQLTTQIRFSSSKLTFLPVSTVRAKMPDISWALRDLCFLDKLYTVQHPSQSQYSVFIIVKIHSFEFGLYIYISASNVSTQVKKAEKQVFILSSC